MKIATVLFIAAAFAFWIAGFLTVPLADRLALWGAGTFLFAYAFRNEGR